MDHLYGIDQDRNNVYHGNLLEAIPEAILYSNERQSHKETEAHTLIRRLIFLSIL